MKYLIIFILFTFMLFSLNCRSSDLNETRKNDLPQVTIGADWTIKKARENSKILAELPDSFDEWQNAYLNIPVKFVLVDVDFEVVIDRTHTFTIAPDNGYVRGITVELAPIFIDDLEGAINEANEWIALFTNLQLSTGVDSRIYSSYNYSMKEARERFLYSKNKGYRQYGTGLKIWKSKKSYYSLGLEQYIGPMKKDKSGENVKKIIYKVMINSWKIEYD